MRRKKPLQVYGPHGLQRMINLILKAWSEDINIRFNGLEKEKRTNLKTVPVVNTGRNIVKNTTLRTLNLGK